MTKPKIFDTRPCLLGESALWHPLRDELFWVDIKNNRLLSRCGDKANSWTFDQMPSALAWIDEFTLLIANDTGLVAFDMRTEATRQLCAIEADNPQTRSNDGRADPWGGFWISTMNNDETLPPAGTIYRWHKGELRTIVSGLSVPNGICFDQRRNLAYYTDSPRSIMWSQKLDPATGWPTASSTVFLDHSHDALIMDGAIIDAEGCLWTALWDGAAVVCYSPEGEELRKLHTQTMRPTCPTFGGNGGRDLFVTTAAIGLSGEPDETVPNGATLFFGDVAKGVPSPRVMIP